jgi:hypothetical protein
MRRLSPYLNVGLAIVFISLSHAIGKSYEMPDKLHARYWNYAIPGAISQLDYGLDGYRAYVSVLRHFVDGHASESTAERRNDLIRSARTIPDAASAGIFFFPGDEKGIRDYVILSFWLFGHATESLYSLYFLLLSVSVGIHMLVFARRPDVQVIGLFAVAGIYVVVPVLPVTSELDSLLNPRAMGLLCFPATISLVCAALVSERPRLWQTFLLAAQMLLVAFVVHIRNAEIWQIAVIVVAIGVGLARGAFSRSRSRNGASGEPRASIWAPAMTLALLCTVFVPAQIYVQTRLAPEYAATKLVRKLFWHNVGMGFSVSRYFRDKYQLTLSDTNFLLLVAHSPEVERLGETGRKVFWSGTFTGQWVGGDPEIDSSFATYYAGMVRDFVAYERLSQAIVARLVRDNPYRAAKLFLVDKPVLMFRNTVNAVRPNIYSIDDLMLTDQASALVGSDDRLNKRIYLDLFSPIGIAAVIGGFVVLLTASRDHLASSVRIALFGIPMVIISTTPVLATYPLIHLMAAPLVALVFATLFAAAAASAWLARKYLGNL